MTYADLRAALIERQEHFRRQEEAEAGRKDWALADRWRFIASGLGDAVTILDRSSADEIPKLDVQRLAEAICGSRPPKRVALNDDLFVDDECRGLAKRVAAEYARLAAKP